MTETHTKNAEPKLKKPSQFQVLLLNDDYTSMDFVIGVLMDFFAKNAEQAQAVMMQVHLQGEAVCGVYSHDIAQTKVTQIIEFARENKQPLMCVVREIKE